MERQRTARYEKADAAHRKRLPPSQLELKLEREEAEERKKQRVDSGRVDSGRSVIPTPKTIIASLRRSAAAAADQDRAKGTSAAVAADKKQIVPIVPIVPRSRQNVEASSSSSSSTYGTSAALIREPLLTHDDVELRDELDNLVLMTSTRAECMQELRDVINEGLEAWHPNEFSTDCLREDVISEALEPAP